MEKQKKEKHKVLEIQWKDLNTHTISVPEGDEREEVRSYDENYCTRDSTCSMNPKQNKESYTWHIEIELLKPMQRKHFKNSNETESWLHNRNNEANDIFQKLKENNSSILEFLTYQKIAFKNKNKIDTFQQTNTQSVTRRSGKENAKSISKHTKYYTKEKFPKIVLEGEWS